MSTANLIFCCGGREGGNENRGGEKELRSSSWTHKHTAVYLHNLCWHLPRLSLSLRYLLLDRAAPSIPRGCRQSPHCRGQGTIRLMRLSPENRTGVAFEFYNVHRVQGREASRSVSFGTVFQPGYTATLGNRGGGDAESHNSHKLWRPNEVGGPPGEWLINVGQTPGGKATDGGRVTTVGLCCL